MELPQMLLPNLNFNVTNMGSDDDIQRIGRRNSAIGVRQRERAITEALKKGNRVTKRWLLSNLRFRSLTAFPFSLDQPKRCSTAIA